METRNITVVTTQNQNKYVVNTDATTLRELKAALSSQNIPFEGMTFYEGLSHTELLTDDSVLPHDVPYKGQVTNELVFMLTTPNKKIKSGVGIPEARQALYDAVKALGLESAIVTVYGRNFTQCKNSELLDAIEKAQKETEDCNANAGVALKALVNILADEEILTEHEAAYVIGLLNGDIEHTNDSPYSKEEIDEMFASIIDKD